MLKAGVVSAIAQEDGAHGFFCADCERGLELLTQTKTQKERVLPLLALFIDVVLISSVVLADG